MCSNKFNKRLKNILKLKITILQLKAKNSQNYSKP